MNMKRIVLLSVVLVLFSAFSQVSGNILSNGGFEDGTNEWRFKEDLLDYANSFSGNVALKMSGELGNTFNTATSVQFDVITNKIYVFSLYSMNNSTTGDLQVGLRWINNAGVSLSYTWKNLELDTGWEYYTYMMRPPKGASKMQIYFKPGAQFIGDAWFDEVSIVEMDVLESEPLVGTGPIGFAGSLTSELSYTPEEDWLGGLRLQLYSNIAFGTSTKGFISIGGWLPQEFQFHEFSGAVAITPRSDFKIKNAYIEIDGPWLTGVSNFRTTLGNVALSYSPYTVCLDRWDLWDWAVLDNSNDPASYNSMKRGVSVETLNWGNMNLGGFLIWEDKPTIYSFGGRLTFGKKNSDNIQLVFAKYQDTTNIAPGEKPVLVDQVITAEGMLARGRFRLRNTLGINTKTTPALSEKGNLNMISAEYQINNSTRMFINHWSLDEKFDPIYRDRTPKYDPYLGKKLEWNIVDRLNGQKGEEIGVSLFKDTNKITLAYSRAHNAEEDLINSTLIKISSLVGKVSTEVDYESTKTKIVPYEFGVNNSEQHLVLNAKYPIYNNGVNSHWVTGIYNFHDTTKWGKDESSYLLLGSRFNLKFIQGLQTFFGLRTIAEEGSTKNGFVLGLDCYLAEAISVTLRYATPNRVEEFATQSRGFWTTRYDKYGHPILADNIIKISASAEF